MVPGRFNSGQWLLGDKRRKMDDQGGGGLGVEGKARVEGGWMKREGQGVKAPADRRR